MGVKRRQVTGARGQAGRSEVRTPEPEARSAAQAGPRAQVWRSDSIELHIEDLVLHGFDPCDRHRIGDAVERELDRLLRERGLDPSLVQEIELPTLDAGTFQITADARPEPTGHLIAQAIHRRLGR